MARPQVAGGGEGVKIWRAAANMLNKQSLTADKGWSSSLWVGWGLTTSHSKKPVCYKMLLWASDFDSLKLRLRPMAGSCEHGNEPSGSIKDGELIS
jgi:hypothetical protein